MAGYPGTRLVQKLGIKPGMCCHVSGAPADYTALLAPLPEGTKFLPRLSKRAQFVHLFAVDMGQLGKALTACRKTLAPTAVVWVSWPKKGAAVETDVGEGTIREPALPLGFVDVKVCAVTEVWSGLKLVVRKQLR